VIFLNKRLPNPNAFKALQEMKMEIANELGIDSQNRIEKNKKHSVGAISTKNFVAMGQKKLIDKE